MLTISQTVPPKNGKVKSKGLGLLNQEPQDLSQGPNLVHDQDSESSLGTKEKVDVQLAGNMKPLDRPSRTQILGTDMSSVHIESSLVVPLPAVLQAEAPSSSGVMY